MMKCEEKVIVVRDFALILVVGIICLAGCLEKRLRQRSAQAERIGTPAGMIRYLQGRKLPALKSVELWENEYGPGLKLITAHYEVFTTLLEPLMLSDVGVDIELDEGKSTALITATVKTTGKTGVEMEALTAVAVSALTIYDMCKAVDRTMRISDIRLVQKSGGKSGTLILE